MSYRDRRLRRAERLRGWAEKRERKSAAAFKGAKTLADAIPFGQPILVGHHSEKRARRDQDRIHNGMRKGIEHADKAASMESRADEIERQAEHAIYSDDDDACERLRERIAALEVKRERIKAVNKAVRKHGFERLVQPDPPFEMTHDEKREFIKLMQICPYHHVETKGFPAYELQNLGGNITRQRARLAQLESVEAQRARVREVLEAEADEARKVAILIHDAAETADMISETDFNGDGEPVPPDPIEAVAEAIAHAEATAAPLVDAPPFSLLPVIGRPGGKQGGLF